MRNLAGRLNARSLASLERIAQEWRIPVSGSDPHVVVGQLYREMRDVRTGRDCWDLLDQDEQEIVRLLAVAERSADLSVTIEELASLLQAVPGQVRETASALFHKGIVAREGDQEALPLGESPRVFLPREIAFLFRRIQDEIDAGEISAASISALLALLDDADVELALELWGSEVVPGLESRDAAAGHLLRVIRDPERRDRVIDALGSDAKAIWDELKAGDPEPRPFLEIIAAAGFESGSPKTSHRLRRSLRELEDSLLVWHMYRPDGTRWLFIPAEIRSSPGESVHQILPSAPEGYLAVDSRLAPPYPNAVAWDLITLVRAVESPDAPSMAGPDDFPQVWREQCSDRFWNSREAGEISEDYLAFLISLGKAETVFEGGDQERDWLRRGRGWNEWRDRSFASQTSRLLFWWTFGDHRIDIIAPDSVAVEDAKWSSLHRKLVSLLQMLDASKWYRVADVAEWVARRNPDILGEHASISLAQSVSGFTDEEQFALAVTLVIRETVERPLAWFGLVQLMTGDDGEELLRTTELLDTLASGHVLTDPAPPAGAPLKWSDEGVIELLDPSPLRVWALLAFADLVSLAPMPQFQISERSLRRTLERGFRLREVTRFLESQTGLKLPVDIEKDLREWSDDFRSTWIEPRIAIALDDPTQLGDVSALITEAGFHVRTSDREYELEVVVPTPEETADVIERLQHLLDGAGFAVRTTR